MSDSFEVLQAKAAMQDEVDRLMAENTQLRQEKEVLAEQADKLARDLGLAREQAAANAKALADMTGEVRSAVYTLGREVGLRFEGDE